MGEEHEAKAHCRPGDQSHGGCEARGAQVARNFGAVDSVDKWVWERQKWMEG